MESTFGTLIIYYLGYIIGFSGLFKLSFALTLICCYLTYKCPDDDEKFDYTKTIDPKFLKTKVEP